MAKDKLKEFLQDVESYHLFSYEEYKTSSLPLKLKKIELLNAYAKIKYGDNNLNPLDVYIDFDGVILDTIRLAKEILKKEHSIDLETHKREDIEEEKIVASFFANLNWKQLINEAKELNESISFIKQLQASIDYHPTIYSAVNSKIEMLEKTLFLQRTLTEISQKYIKAKFPKTCENEESILIDDDDFNLTNWPGKPVHFAAGRTTIFPSITDLGEIYYLFTRDDITHQFIYPKELYSNYEQVLDTKSKQKIWRKKGIQNHS